MGGVGLALLRVADFCSDEAAAAAAVSQDSQLGPVVRVRQGEPIRVFTARDLDFSGV